MKILPAFCMVLVLVLQSCETVNTPVPLLPSRFGRGVEFVAGVGKTVPPKLRLIEKSNGTVLAEAESLFTPDAIDCVGKPEGDGFVVLASGTGNTVAVYEDVSDASPENQIVLFMRNADGSWAARRTQPPHRDGPIYGTTGHSVAIDDEFLFYSFDLKKVEKVRFEALRGYGRGTSW